MGNKHSGGKSKFDLHPQKAELEADLVLKRKSTAEVAAIIGCHPSSVNRHIQLRIDDMRRHEILAEDRVRRANEITSMLNDERLDVSRTYESLAKRVDAIVSRAESTEDDAFALAGLESLRKVLRDIASLQGKLAQNLTVTVALSEAPEWLRVRQIFRELVDAHPEIRPTLLRLLNEEKLSVTKGDSSAGI
ncbi:MAG: hypothetical protein AAF198_11830 [Pseudomonadota bacterium]